MFIRSTMLFAGSSWVCMLSFKSVAPFFLSSRSTIFGFFIIQKGVWPYRYAEDIPLVTLILNIYRFVGLTSSVNRGYTDRQTDRQTDYCTL